MIQDNTSLRSQNSQRMTNEQNMLELPKKFSGRNLSAASGYSTQQDSTQSKAGSDPFANAFDYSD